MNLKFQQFQPDDLFWIDYNHKYSSDYGVIIDRDGVFIKQIHLLHKLEDIYIFPETYQALEILNSNKIPAILATNQTILARNLAKEQFIFDSHQHILNLLEKHGVYLDGILCCCHTDFPETESPQYYKQNCSWRKPNAGMTEFILKKFNLNPDKTYGIGDKMRDILSYQKAGIKDILVETGHAGVDPFSQAQPTIIKPNILEAINFITNNS